MSTRQAPAKHILIVEDEAHLAIGMKYNFEAEGYRVSTASDGTSALKLIEESAGDIDLVVLDLMLPGMSGYAVCEALREAGDNVPILILSSRTLTEDRVRGFDLGADQYLTKPFELDELLSITRNLLQRRPRTIAPSSPAPTTENTYEFGRTKVNFDTFEVTADEKPLRLTYMEMKLLKYFIDHEGSVISRAELLENVWGLSSNSTTRTVDNFLVRFRKYFEQNPARPKHFLSVRGAGYRFVRREESK